MDDCLIVGGGIIGLSLAYELARTGLDVHVIDRQMPGREASWAGAGILPPANQKTAVHPLEQLRGLSHRLHEVWASNLREETEIDTGYRRCGGLYLARSPGEAASLHAFSSMLREVDITIDRLSFEQLAELEPALRPITEAGKLNACYSLPDEAQLRNPDHLAALVTACERRGVRLTSNVEATGFEFANGRIQCVQTNKGELHAGNFCLTGGAWTYSLLQRLGIKNGIMPIRGQMVLFKCKERPFRRVINEGPRYIVPRDDGHVLVGSTEEEVGFDKSTTPDAIRELSELARELVPALKDASVERTWAGLRPGSFDGFPYLGRVPGLDNAYVAAGHFRSGLHLSPGTAVVMSQLIRGEPPEIDLTEFRVGRG